MKALLASTYRHVRILQACDGIRQQARRFEHCRARRRWLWLGAALAVLPDRKRLCACVDRVGLTRMRRPVASLCLGRRNETRGLKKGLAPETRRLARVKLVYSVKQGLADHGLSPRRQITAYAHS